MLVNPDIETLPKVWFLSLKKLRKALRTVLAGHLFGWRDIIWVCMRLELRLIFSGSRGAWRDSIWIARSSLNEDIGVNRKEEQSSIAVKEKGRREDQQRQGNHYKYAFYECCI